MKNYYTPVYGAGLFMLLCYLYSGQAFGQNTYPLSGTVTDTTGQVIPGVHVQRIGTSQGTTTNFEGQYTLAVQASDSLTFTYLGLAPQRLAVNGRQELNVQLQPDQEALDAVVINAGYYTMNKRESTANIAKVDAEDIERQPAVNPLEALQGRVPGVSVRNQSGLPGAAISVNIRGQNSIRSEANYPLYVIDGVPISAEPLSSIGGLYPANIGIDPLSSLNPNDIKSIEILKDADATAIYGSRGANGVVLITTKSGKAGKTRFHVEAQTGVAHAPQRVELLNTPDYLEMRREAFANDGVEPSMGNAPDLLLWDQDRYTDWLDELIGGTALLTQYTAGISGGSERTRYRLSGNLREESTVFPGDFGQKKVTASLQVSHHTPEDAFRINTSINYGRDQQDLFNVSTLMPKVFELPPNAPEVRNPDGGLNWALDENGSPTFDNPYALFEQKHQTELNNLIANTVLDLRLLPDLRLKTNLGYTYLVHQENTIYPKSAMNPLVSTYTPSSTRVSEQKASSYIVEPQLSYRFSMGNSHIETLVGATWQENRQEGFQILGRDYAQDGLLGNLGGAKELQLLGAEAPLYRYQALFARIGYSYKRKYFVNLTGRRDGSSRFGPDNRFANFGAVGGAWIFSKEKAVKEALSFLSFGKLRGSYGSTGSDQIGNYNYLDTYRPIELVPGSPSPGGLYPSRLANDNYGWEVNKKLEIALELGFVNDRLFLSTGYYRNRSSNQLVGLPLSAITGFTSTQANLPATVENRGWELELEARPFTGDNFTWTTRANLSIPRNELISYPNLEGSPYAQVYEIGKPLALAQLYESKGVNPETGLYEVVDQNGDGTVNADDYARSEFLGRTAFGGWQNTFRYKGLELDFLWEFVWQKGYGIRNLFAYPPGFRYNQPSSVMGRWQNPGDQADIQRFSQDFASYTNYYQSNTTSNNIKNAAYLRLATLSLAYNLPQAWVNSLKLSSFKLYARGQNLWTISDFPGMDPQNPGSLQLPALRRFSFGARINF